MVYSGVVRTAQEYMSMLKADGASSRHSLAEVLAAIRADFHMLCT